MPRHHIPVGFRPVAQSSPNAPAFQLENDKGHKLSVHPLTDGLVRVTHQLPEKYKSRWSAGVKWESSALSVSNGLALASNGENKSILSTKSLKLSIDWSNGCPQLRWFSTLPGKESPDGAPFLSDCSTRAYTFDAATGGVLHYVEREDWFPVSEHEPSPASPLGPNDEPFVSDRRNEFVYGLGEASGGILRTARKFTLEARDGAGYDMENGGPLYKVTPFYIVFNKKTRLWCGVYYNSLANDASLDLGAECDALFNGFRTYRAGCGPLDYYVILGDGTLPSVISTYAALVSPSLGTNNPKTSQKDTSCLKAWRASFTLPPRSQFGFLASSLAVSAELHAQEAILDFVKTCRGKGFPVDALHLSSGWCQHPETGNRHYFVWNRPRYPDPRALGAALEKEMNIRIIVNIKPWLLDDHPLYEEALKSNSYVKAAEDAPDPNVGAAKSILWSNGLGEHMYGSYLDFSTPGAVEWWSRHIKEDLVGVNMTGMWIDNNEYSGLVDDAEGYEGKCSFWGGGGDWESRLGWGGGETTVGQVGRLIQMMGMAKTTHDTMLEVFPKERPVIVTRAAIPGMQAYAHGTWSGDNTTSWIALRRGTAMTLSAGISFLPGLYGHDIGGLTGKHHPSPELLGAWHTRFTVHSWKEVSTTLWMYDGVEVDGVEITSLLRDIVGFRYQIIPTMYSLYVDEYWKQGWPVLRPMFWYHSADPKTLALDEQFLFGSHALVAPVLSFGHRTKRVYLPSAVDGTNEVPEWCELDTGTWHTSPSDGGFVDIDAPLSRTPVLVRAGGILVLSNKCTETVYDGGATRVAHIFPSSSSQAGGAKGSFKLVEDDGKSNEHVEKGAFTELELSFQVGEKGQQVVEVDVKELSNSYNLPYSVIWFILPLGDNRKLRVPTGSARKTSEQKADDGRVMFGVHIS